MNHFTWMFVLSLCNTIFHLYLATSPRHPQPRLMWVLTAMWFGAAVLLQFEASVYMVVLLMFGAVLLEIRGYYALRTFVASVSRRSRSDDLTNQ